MNELIMIVEDEKDVAKLIRNNTDELPEFVKTAAPGGYPGAVVS